MGENRKAPGQFCWFELVTSDAAGAKAFYGSLMGWGTRDDHVPGGGVYTHLKLEGRSIGALYELSDPMKQQQVPPHWMPYVSVEDVDQVADRAKEFGGAIVVEPLTVPEAGKLSVLQDPTGAAFSLWQPLEHCGVDAADGEVGTVCWTELATRDTGSAGAFYERLFGWDLLETPMENMTYTMFQQDGAPVAGMLSMTDEWGDIPPHWMNYFAVNDCDAVVAKLSGLGGKVMVPPQDVPDVGRFSCVQDPQGATFCVIRLAARTASSS